jgi:GxxExxY protein
VERQKDISLFFRGSIVGYFKADLIAEEKIIIELKAVRTLDPAHEAQLINYLKARPPRLRAKPMAGRQQILRLAYY